MPTYGASLDLIQQATGAPRSTVRRWKARPDTIPPAAARLIRFAVWGDLAEVFGIEWKDFKISGGKLYPPYFHGGFTPLDIAAMFFKLQELEQTRRDNARLLRELGNEKMRAETYRALVAEQPKRFIY